MSGLCFTSELHKIALLRNLALGIPETPDSGFGSGKSTNFSRGNSVSRAVGGDEDLGGTVQRYRDFDYRQQYLSATILFRRRLGSIG